jgi:hypothetical protein
VHGQYVLDTFGRPARTYRYGPLTIMVWHKNLLPYLDTGYTAPAGHGVTTVSDPARRDDRGLRGA